MRKAEVSKEDFGDRIKWNCKTKVANPKQLGKKANEKKEI